MKLLRGLMLGVFLASSTAHAQLQLDNTVDTTITLLSSFNYGYGNGDVVFQVAHPKAACPAGYWLTKSDPGYTNSLSMLMMAYQAKNTVMVVGHTNQIWPGSSATYCKLSYVNLK